MVDSAKWFVVNTYSSYEKKVKQDIELLKNKFKDLIFEVKIPTAVSEVVRRGKLCKVERKLFPGYVIVKMIMTDETWFAIKNIKGVHNFIGPASKPTPLSEAEVKSLEVEKIEVEVDYKVGDEVKIVSGPSIGFTGCVSKLDLKAGLATVTVSIFGRKIPVEVKLNQIVANL